MSFSIEHVNAAYGASQVLWDVSLSVGDSEAVALLGRNGVGKTTLIRAIMGLHPVLSGRILLDGRDLTHLPAHERSRSGIAYVPQGRGIFPHLTVEENLQMGLLARSGNGMSAGKQKLDYVLDLFPALKNLGPRKGGNLSGGEQQQLALARALVSGPRLLLLDEPTEGIQPSVVQQIEDVLARISSELGIAILLIEQYLEFAWSFAGQYYVMEKGRIIDAGKPAEENLPAVTALLRV